MPISGRNDQRVLFGALNVANAHRVLLRRAKTGAVDFQAFLRCLRTKHYRAGQPIWLLLDKASCHTAAGSLALAARLDITATKRAGRAHVQPRRLDDNHLAEDASPPVTSRHRRSVF